MYYISNEENGGLNMDILAVILGVVAVIVVLASIRQIDEYEKGIKFTRGKYSKTLGSGWHIIWPIFQSLRKIDVRTKVIDVPEQDTITKDNISIKINAVIYYNIFDAKKAVLSVQRYDYAVSQLAQTTMRNIVGSVTLDELLTERDSISSNICSIVDKATDAWGVKIENVELKDVAVISTTTASNFQTVCSVIVPFNKFSYSLWICSPTVNVLSSSSLYETAFENSLSSYTPFESIALTIIVSFNFNSTKFVLVVCSCPSFII